MLKRDFLFILKIFLIWRVGVFLISFLAIRFLPVLSHNYFGNGYSNYILNPLFWGHFNFDGEHYLSIALTGYHSLEYFFFPLFPVLMGYFSPLIGLIISNLFFLMALIGVYKLVMIDFKDNIAKLTIILFLVFPASFYFAAYYTESLFLMLVVWSFLLARKNRFLFASVIAALASATRVVGLVMFFVLFLEFLKYKNFKLKIYDIKEFWPILFSPLGVLTYMYFLLKKTGDPLIFLHQVSIFGEQRSSNLILLPQVFYRYIFEILPHVSYLYFPNVFTTYLEFISGVIILILVIYSLFRLRLSYFVYGVITYLIPTLAGSFSSMPRYALAIFPVFILSAAWISKLPKVYRNLLIFGMIVMLAIAEAMFWRGYWIS